MSQGSVTRRDVVRAAAGVGTVLGLGALGACTVTSGKASPTPTSSVEATLAKLDAAWGKAFPATGMAGGAAQLTFEGHLWAASDGLSDIAAKTDFDPASYTRIASITKTFTATAVLRLVADGKLALDDLLSRWYPTVPNAASVTLVQMLGMQSGLPDYTSDAGFLKSLAADPTMPWNVDDVVKVIQPMTPLFAPGAEVSYCDSNYYLLGAIAAQVSGRSLPDVYADVCAKAGLSHTYYPTDLSLRDPHVHGYLPTVTSDGSFDTKVPPKDVTAFNPDLGAGAGGLVSTLDDLATWGKILVDGSLLTPELQKQRMDTRRFNGQKLNVGYGLGVMNVNHYFGHDGAIEGFSSVVLTRPDTGTQVVVIGNESTIESTPSMDIAVTLLQQVDPKL